jgi:hypothetical protein
MKLLFHSSEKQKSKLQVPWTEGIPETRHIPISYAALDLRWEPVNITWSPEEASNAKTKWEVAQNMLGISFCRRK